MAMLLPVVLAIVTDRPIGSTISRPGRGVPIPSPGARPGQKSSVSGGGGPPPLAPADLRLVYRGPPTLSPPGAGGRLGRAVEGPVGCLPLRSSRRRPWGGAPSNFCIGISEVNTLGHPVQTYTNPGPLHRLLFTHMQHILGAPPHSSSLPARHAWAPLQRSPRRVRCARCGLGRRASRYA
jgi:hypothetical protein